MRRITLENGVRIFFEQTGGGKVSLVGMFKTGSRHDPKRVRGLGHGLEHMMAQATDKFPSWEDLCGRTDEFCSAYNAETDKETILFFLKMKSCYIRSGIKILDQNINHPRFMKQADDAPDFAHERERLTEERRQANDLPDEWADERLDQIMFKGGLAHTIDGPVPVIKRYTARRLRDWYRQVVVGRRLTIVVSGEFNEELVEASLRRAFGSLPPGRAIRTPRSTVRRSHPQIRLRNEPDKEQVHFVISFPTFGHSDPDRYALHVLRNYLSQRSSSRVKVHIDRIGHGYSSNDFLVFFPEIGQYGIRVWLAPEKFLDTVRIFASHIEKLCSTLITKKELRRSKLNISTDTDEDFGDPLYAGKFKARQLATLGCYVPVPEFLREINAVTAHQVKRVARRIFRQRRMILVATGPLDGINKKQIRKALYFRKRKSKSTKPSA